MNEFFAGVVAHILVAGAGGVIGYVVKKNWLWIGKLFDSVAREQAKYIRGEWTATEKFSDDNSQAKYKLALACRGAQVSGTQSYTSGRADKHAVFDLTGSFMNSNLNLTWTKKGSIETGAMTLRLTEDKRLEGHGLYIVKQKVYTSTFTATKI